jgi:hypothetical protein
MPWRKVAIQEVGAHSIIPSYPEKTLYDPFSTSLKHSSVLDILPPSHLSVLL